MEPTPRRLDSFQFADVYPFAILTEEDARRLSSIVVQPADVAAVQDQLSQVDTSELVSTDDMIRFVAAATRFHDLGRLEQALADLGTLVSQAELDGIACRVPLQLNPEGGRVARFDLSAVPSLLRDGGLLPKSGSR